MRLIRAQLRTGWKRMAEARWIGARDGSRPGRDCGRRWMIRDGPSPEMDRGRIWIATGDGWMTGDGS